MGAISNQWRFLKGYLHAPTCVGAVAPSSRALAEALSRPYRECASPARVLEVGAGTGPVTSYLASQLGDQDELHVCEIRPDFAHILEQTVLTEDRFGAAIGQKRVRLYQMPIQELDRENYYDFVISGLPLTAFSLRDIKDVLRVIRKSLKSGGVLSYFEYVALRKAVSRLTPGVHGKKRRVISAYLSRNIRRYQFAKETVLQNMPPAHARHLRFD